MRTQVLVAGAGPVGLTMAAELARYGVGVRIVDKAAARTDKSKALVVWGRTMELLDRAGCASAFLAAGLKVHAANINAGLSQIGHVSMGGIDTPYPFALMVPQSETERLLEEHLGTLGVTVERRVELMSFVDAAEGVSAVVQKADGSSETIEADWLIGCDGAHSTVRHGLGFPFLGSTLPTEFMLADVHLAGGEIHEAEISTFWHEDGVVVFFPMLPGRYRIVADTGPAAEASRAEPTLAEVQALVDRRGPGGVTVSDPVWLARFGVNERMVADYRAGRVFVAGDAAHIHSPAGGQGMNTGMQDALNLAWKLALVCRGLGSADALLDSYSVERSAVGAKVLAAAGHLTDLAMIRNHTAQAIRNFIAHHLLGFRPVQQAMASSLSEISVGYPESPLNGESIRIEGPGPGERKPPAKDESPIGAGDTPRFAVYSSNQAGHRDVVARHAAIVEAECRPAIDPDGIWLVRPDGYVALVAEAGRWGEVTRYLDRIAGT